MLELKENERGVFLKVRVQPRASKNEIKGMQGDAVKIRLTSPPVDGEANAACQRFLAELFKISKKQVLLITGQTSRNKTLLIEGLSKKYITDIINKYI